MSCSVYMDNSATTPIRQEALEAMVKTYRDTYGNSSSIHAFGRAASKALEGAREEFAACIGAEAEEIYFTSGGTESDNLAIHGIASALHDRGDQIVTSPTEHHAVLHCCEALKEEGCRVTFLGVDHEGLIDLDDLRGALGDRTILVSVMLANNETGTLQPLQEICHIAAERGIAVHSDAVQAAGKIPLDANDLGVDILSFSGHKFYGPKGVGALYVRKGTGITPQLRGGHHEGGLRPGTVNVPGIVGMTAALKLATLELRDTAARLGELKQMLATGIMERIDGVHHNGSREHALPNLLNLSFEGADGEALLLDLDRRGVACSTGSACTSDSTEPSHVLTAMGVPARLAQCSLRFSLGRDNNREEVAYVLDILPDVVRRIRDVALAGTRTT